MTVRESRTLLYMQISGVFFISALLTRSDPQAVNTAKNYCLLSNRLRQQNVLTVKTALDDDNID